MTPPSLSSSSRAVPVVRQGFWFLGMTLAIELAGLFVLVLAYLLLR